MTDTDFSAINLRSRRSLFFGGHDPIVVESNDQTYRIGGQYSYSLALTLDASETGTSVRLPTALHHELGMTEYRLRIGGFNGTLRIQDHGGSNLTALDGNSLFNSGERFRFVCVRNNSESGEWLILPES